jgi:predicted RNase H-like HicB family nuclease
MTPDGVAPMIFTVDLAPDQRGTFLVTCREVADVVIFAEDEEAGLARAEQAIRDALEALRPSPDLPS